MSKTQDCIRCGKEAEKGINDIWFCKKCFLDVAYMLPFCPVAFKKITKTKEKLLEWIEMVDNRVRVSSEKEK